MHAVKTARNSKFTKIEVNYVRNFLFFIVYPSHRQGCCRVNGETLKPSRCMYVPGEFS